MVLTDDLVRKGFKGFATATNWELRASNEVLQDDLEAIKLVEQNQAEFQALVDKHLTELPLTEEYFGPLITTRLGQEYPLKSDLITDLFRLHSIVEQRLQRLVHAPVGGLATLKNEYRSSEDVTQGDLTDSIARDLLAEILILDFLIELGFEDIQKVEPTRLPHVDILARKDTKNFAFEITRKKKKDWELGTNTHIEDCTSIANRKMMEDVLRRALKDKNKQFKRAIEAGTLNPSRIRVIAIKTTDYGFSECISEAGSIGSKILSRPGQWQFVDQLWLIPNTEASESQWIRK